MKKIPLLLLLLATMGFNSFSQSITLANWDGKAPVSVAAWAGTVTQNATDPVVSSNHVLKYVRGTNTYSAFAINVDSTKMLKYQQLSLDVYADSVKSLMVDLIDNWGDTVSVANSFAVKYTTWSTLTLNYAGNLTIHPYKEIVIYPDPSATTASNYYFDNVKLVGLDANADSSIIAKETFGTADCRQRAAGGLNPPFNYPVDTFTKAHASGYYYSSIHGTSTQAVDSFRGNDTWYAYTLYNNLPAGQKVFTVKNGRWTDQYAFWASSAGGAGSSESYPGYSAANNILMAPSGRYAFSWDTIQIDNINISGFKNLKFGFGAYLREATKKHGIFVSYSIDGGAWTNFCDTSAYINFPATAATWKFVTTPKLASTVVGSNMSIRFNTLPVNLVDAARYYLDDMTLMGTPINLDSVMLPKTGTIDTIGHTLQLSASTYPANAYYNSVIWSVTPGTGAATVSQTGLVTGTAFGTATVTATAVDGGLSASTLIHIGKTLSKITVMSAGNATTIATSGATLQMSYSFTPAAGATDTTITWSIVGTAAKISGTGLLTPISNGVVYAKAVANYGSAKDSMMITLSNQVPVTGVTVMGKLALNADHSVDTLYAQVIPTNATDRKVIWSTDDGNGDLLNVVVINDTAIQVSTIRNGVVTLIAQSESDATKADTVKVTITNQVAVPFDLTTFKGDRPIGTQIDTLSDKNPYLKVRLNGWSTAFAIAPLTFYKNTTVKFSYKYDQDTSSVTAASVQSFIQFMKAGATAENIAVTDKPASTTIKQLSVALKADTVNQLQLAAQSTSTWSAMSGPVLYIGQMTFTSPLDLTTMLGDIPAGATIVDTLSQRFLKIRLNAWNTAFPVAKMIFTANEKVTFSYKYAQDTSSVAASTVQAFVQFMMANATEENISITDKPASTTVKSITATLKADTINQLQLAAQLTSGSWSAVAGPILYVSQMVFTPPVLVTSIAISGGTAITTAKGTLALIATITPATAANKTVTWSVDNSAVATIDPKTGILTAVTNGTVVVTATANDGSKVKATASIIISGQVSVQTLSAASIGLYPNPVSDVLHLSNTSTVTRVEIFNINGQVVLMLRNTDAQMEINTAGLSNGIYFLRAYTGNNVITKQFVK